MLPKSFRRNGFGIAADVLFNAWAGKQAYTAAARAAPKPPGQQLTRFAARGNAAAAWPDRPWGRGGLPATYRSQASTTNSGKASRKRRNGPNVPGPVNSCADNAAILISRRSAAVSSPATRSTSTIPSGSEHPRAAAGASHTYVFSAERGHSCPQQRALRRARHESAQAGVRKLLRTRMSALR